MDGNEAASAGPATTPTSPQRVVHDEHRRRELDRLRANTAELITAGVIRPEDITPAWVPRLFPAGLDTTTPTVECGVYTLADYRRGACPACGQPISYCTRRRQLDTLIVLARRLMEQIEPLQPVLKVLQGDLDEMLETCWNPTVSLGNFEIGAGDRLVELHGSEKIPV